MMDLPPSCAYGVETYRWDAAEQRFVHAGFEWKWTAVKIDGRWYRTEHKPPFSILEWLADVCRKAGV